MFRCLAAFVFALPVAMLATPAHAQWLTNFSNNAHEAYLRNKAWPEPFLSADRAAASMPFAIMVANGWRRQNLLCDYHFNEETQQLNMAGEMKVRFILTQMPPSRRTIFVQRGLTPDVTATRLAGVERSTYAIAPPGMIAAVVESDLPSDGWPADEIDSVSRRFEKTRPDPRLKSASSGDSTSSGSGNK